MTVSASNPQGSTPQAPRGASSEPSGASSGSTSPSSAPQPAPHPDLLLVTIRAKTGEIVKVESADSSGSRHELTDEDKADLGKESAKATLEGLLERAFEAGIACMLGDGRQDEALEPEESEEEAELRHLLLGPLIKDSPARRLMTHEVLSRAMLGTVVRQAITPASPERESHPAQQRPGGRAGRSR